MTGMFNTTPLMALAIAGWLETERGFMRDANISADRVEKGGMMVPSLITVSVTADRITWQGEVEDHPNEPTLLNFASFKAWFDDLPKTWKIGCRTVRVDKNRRGLTIDEDNISIPKSTLEEMLKELL